MDSAIQIQFNHHVQEHVSASRLYYSKRSRWAQTDRVVAIAMIVLGIAWVSLAGVRWWTVIWFVLAPLEFFNLLSIDPLVVRWRFKGSPKFQEKNTLVFGEGEIQFQTPTIDARLRWEMYSELLENEQVFLLVYGKQMYSVIPKRAFQNDAERTRFRELAGRKLTSPMRPA